MSGFEPYGQRILPDGRMAEINYLLFGRARINVGPAELPYYDDGW